MNTSYFKLSALPSHKEIFSLTEKMCDILDGETAFYRPPDKEGKPGGLLDFSENPKPVVVVPDLHARSGFLKNILDYQISVVPEFLDTRTNETVLSALEKGLLHLVFLGDALHSEKTTKVRWLLAEKDYKNEIYSGPSIKEEMTEGLSLLMELFELKTNIPESFHFLKGNHENIMNVTEGGDFAFRKYADEGNMVKAFVSDFYGDDVLYLLSCYEKALPLVYCGKNCCISHAEPLRGFSKEEIIDARNTSAEIVYGLTWTKNDEAHPGSVSKTIENLGLSSETVRWFSGHRTVQEDYSTRQNGMLYQIHNPRNQNIFLVPVNEKFDPSKHIIGVGR